MLGNLWVLTICPSSPSQASSLGRIQGRRTSQKQSQAPLACGLMLEGPLYTPGPTGELGLSGSRPTGMTERTGQAKGAHLTR